MPPIVIYTKSSCPYCQAAKDLLRRKGAQFEEISVDGDRAAQAAMAAKAGDARPCRRSLSATAMSAAATISMPSTARAGSILCSPARLMIKFPLACERGHEFESWFPDGEAYETQARRGLVPCPDCDSRRVTKALMTPGGVSARGRPGRNADRARAPGRADRRKAARAARRDPRVAAGRSRPTPTTSARSSRRSRGQSKRATSPSGRSAAARRSKKRGAARRGRRRYAAADAARRSELRFRGRDANSNCNYAIDMTSP